MADPVLAQVGARLAELRKDAKLSQAEVARRSGYSIQYVSQLEGGRRNAPLLTLLAICNAIGTTPAALFGSVSLPQPRPLRGSPLMVGARQLVRRLERLPAAEGRQVLRAIEAMLALRRR